MCNHLSQLQPALEVPVVAPPPTARRLRADGATVGARLAAPTFVLLWSSAFIAGTVGLRSAPPLLLTLIRLAAAGVILALVAWVTRARWPRGRELGHVIVAGLLLQAAQFGGFYWAMSLGLPAALTALIQGLTPVLTATAAWLLLGERTSPTQRLGFVLGAAGVVLAVAGRMDVHAGVRAALIPAAVGLVGGGLGMLYQQRYCRGMDLRTGTATQLLASVPVLALLAFTVEHPEVSRPLSLAGSLAWLVLVNSIGAFLLMYTMLRHRPASAVSSLFFLTPAVTAVLAFIFLGQGLGWATVAGLVVSGAGVTLATRQPRAAEAAPAVGTAPARAAGTAPDAGTAPALAAGAVPAAGTGREAGTAPGRVRAGAPD
jgi:drug/metabolite transporter (DMT)-like permease